jgi:hypothetical protein
MAAGLTDHCWSVRELLSVRLPPSPPQWPPIKGGRAAPRIIPFKLRPRRRVIVRICTVSHVSTI